MNFSSSDKHKFIRNDCKFVGSNSESIYFSKQLTTERTVKYIPK